MAKPSLTDVQARKLARLAHEWVQAARRTVDAQSGEPGYDEGWGPRYVRLERMERTRRNRYFAYLGRLTSGDNP